MPRRAADLFSTPPLPGGLIHLARASYGGAIESTEAGLPAYAGGMGADLEQRITVQLRWRDMDMLGHLNQSVYHELLEEGRAAVMSELMRRAGDSHSPGAYVLAHVDLDYRTEVRKDHGELEVLIRVGDVGTSSFRLHHELRLPDGTVAASGQTVMVAWDPATRGKRPLTAAERAALS
jgi:acyl-CoA thioester hydrolase